MKEHKVTERRAYRVLGVNRTAYRYKPIKLPDEDEVRAAVIEKVCNYGRVICPLSVVPEDKLVPI